MIPSAGRGNLRTSLAIEKDESRSSHAVLSSCSTSKDGACAGHGLCRFLPFNNPSSALVGLRG